MGAKKDKTYLVGSAIFLLGADNGARSLGCVDCGLALHDSFTVDATAARTSDFAANSSDVVPVLVGHFVQLSLETDEKERQVEWRWRTVSGIG